MFVENRGFGKEPFISGSWEMFPVPLTSLTRTDNLIVRFALGINSTRQQKVKRFITEPTRLVVLTRAGSTKAETLDLYYPTDHVLHKSPPAR